MQNDRIIPVLAEEQENIEDSFNAEQQPVPVGVGARKRKRGRGGRDVELNLRPCGVSIAWWSEHLTPSEAGSSVPSKGGSDFIQGHSVSVVSVMLRHYHHDAWQGLRVGATEKSSSRQNMPLISRLAFFDLYNSFLEKHKIVINLAAFPPCFAKPFVTEEDHNAQWRVPWEYFALKQLSPAQQRKEVFKERASSWLER